jgi:hypothetical protein
MAEEKLEPEQTIDDIDALRVVLYKVRGSSAVSTPALRDTLQE